MSITPVFGVLVCGRFMYGLCAGIMFGLVPKMLIEYLSIEEFGKGYGLIPTLGIELFKFALLGFYMIYMVIKDDSEDDSPDWYWRFNYGFPIIFLSLSTILFGLSSKRDSFHHIMEEKNKE